MTERTFHTSNLVQRNGPFIGIGCGIVFGALVLIGLYGKQVGITSQAREVQKKIEALHGEQATMQQQIVALTSSEHLRKLATTLSLVEEKTPEYFRTGEQWAAALR